MDYAAKEIENIQVVAEEVKPVRQQIEKRYILDDFDVEPTIGKSSTPEIKNEIVEEELESEKEREKEKESEKEREISWSADREIAPPSPPVTFPEIVGEAVGPEEE